MVLNSGFGARIEGSWGVQGTRKARKSLFLRHPMASLRTQQPQHGTVLEITVLEKKNEQDKFQWS